ncbi:NADPH-dependent FMN reductase [soil metagenome]
MSRFKILAISGSIRHHSSNQRILEYISSTYSDQIEIEIYNGLTRLPYFNPDDDIDCKIEEVIAFRNKISSADAVIFCTPEYVFSIPGVLKNALEWLVSTTVLLDKPIAIITASSLGENGHESLQLILKTLGGAFNENTTMLVSGVRSKVNELGEFNEDVSRIKLQSLMTTLISSINFSSPESISS